MIEDVVICLYGVKVFMKFDVRNGFWYIKLDDSLLYLIIFNMLFGCYWWKCMFFGIWLVLEIF